MLALCSIPSLKVASWETRSAFMAWCAMDVESQVSPRRSTLRPGTTPSYSCHQAAQRMIRHTHTQRHTHTHTKTSSLGSHRRVRDDLVLSENLRVHRDGGPGFLHAEFKI